MPMRSIGKYQVYLIDLDLVESANVVEKNTPEYPEHKLVLLRMRDGDEVVLKWETISGAALWDQLHAIAKNENA